MENKNKIEWYAIKKKNREKEGTHWELRVNLGYTDKIVSVERNLIAEVLDKSIRQLEEEFEIDKKIIL